MLYNAGSKSGARAYSLPGAEMVLMMMMMMMMNLARSNVPSIELFFRCHSFVYSVVICPMGGGLHMMPLFRM